MQVSALSYSASNALMHRGQNDWRRRTTVCCYIAASGGIIDTLYEENITNYSIYVLQICSTHYSKLWKHARGMTRVKSRTQSSEITVEITVFSRNLKHFSVYYHPRLIIALKSQLKSPKLISYTKINPCHTPRRHHILFNDHMTLSAMHLCSLNCSVAVQLCLSPLNTDLLL